jgi:hypothetical protein
VSRFARLPLLVPALAVLAFALVPAAGAQAATAGVNLAGIPTPADLDAAAASGAHSVRVFARWIDAQPSPGAIRPEWQKTFQDIASGAKARGMTPVFVITASPQWASGSANANTPPSPDHVGDFAAFTGQVAGLLKGNGAAYEIWNEEDEPDFWSSGPDPARYVALLKGAYGAIKAADPAAPVILGPLTGNNYDFLQQLYDAGAKGSFDAAAVHTDTACLDRGPDQFYRDNGRLARFTFLGYREVRQTMLANGDDKAIWMTELGWSTTGQTCSRGTWAGQKPAGVTEADQATYLRQAFHCMAGDAYVQQALWFTQRDAAAADGELNRYGLLRFDGSAKPSLAAFSDVAAGRDTITGPCGDFAPPAITIQRPTAGVKYAEALTIQAVATDASGIGRITFKADGKEIRNFTGADAKNGQPVGLQWQGSKNLSLGKHTITVDALDPSGNTSTQSVDVFRVDPSKLGKTLPTKVTVKSLKRAGRKATLRGSVVKSGELGLSGKAQVVWQWKASSKAKFKTLHKSLKPANKPFTFTQRLRKGGSWRVQVRYLAVAPYKASASTWKAFTVK